MVWVRNQPGTSAEDRQRIYLNMGMMRSHVALIEGDETVILLIDIEKLEQPLKHEVIKRSYTFRDLANVLDQKRRCG